MRYYMTSQSRTRENRLFAGNGKQIVATHMKRGYWIYQEYTSPQGEFKDRHGDTVYIEECEPFNTPQGECHYKMVNQTKIDQENKRKENREEIEAAEVKRAAELAEFGKRKCDCILSSDVERMQVEMFGFSCPHCGK